MRTAAMLARSRRCRWWMGALLLALAATSVLGCGPLYPVLGALLGADAARSSSEEEPAPTASVDRALARVTLSSAESVRIPFRLQQPSGFLARVEVSWAPADRADDPAAFQPASVDAHAPPDERALERLQTSPSGEPHAFRWDAGKDLAAYAQGQGATTTALQVVVRIQPFLGDRPGAPLLLPAFEAGNDRPAVSGATLPDAAEGNQLGSPVIVRFDVSDTSADPVSVDLFYSTDGGQTYKEATRATGVAKDLGSSRPPGTSPHDFVWDSLADLHRVRVEGVRLRLRVRDRFTTFQSATVTNGAAAFLGPVTIANNGLPRVLLSEPALQLDRTNELPLRVTVTDPESDAVDLVIQWTPVGEPFLPIDGLATPAPADPGGPLLQSALADAERYHPTPGTDLRERAVRRAALRDPEARRRLRLISLAPVQLEDRVGLVPARLDVRLPALAELGAPPRQLGHAVRFLDGLCAGEVRRIVAYDPSRALATLDANLPAVPAVGDRVEIERSEGLEGLTSTPGGVEHDLVWDTLRDLGALDRTVKLRVVGFDAEAGAGYTTQPFEIRNASFRETARIEVPHHRVEVGDLNRDGRDDLLIAGPSSAAPLTVLAGQPDGSFVATSLSGISSVRPGDVVGHILAIEETRALVAIRASNDAESDGQVRMVFFAPGTLSPLLTVLDLTLPGILDARVGELNGDGWPDLVLARMVTSTPSGIPGVALEVAYGQAFDPFDLSSPPAPFVLPPIRVASATTTFLGELRTVDLDGDGRTEVLALAGSRGFSPVGMGGAREILLVRFGANGLVATSTPLPADMQTEIPGPPLALGRLGEAGPPHVFVSAGTSLHELALGAGGDSLQTIGSGTPIGSLPFASVLAAAMSGTDALNHLDGSLVTGFALRDLNGDGRSDLAVRKEVFDTTAGTVRVSVELFEVGAGGGLVQLAAFDASRGSALGLGGQVLAGDFDGDGAADLASTALAAPIAVWSGAPPFQADDALLGVVAATGVSAFDRDGDGRPDAVATSRAGGFFGSPTAESSLFDQTAAGALEPVGQLSFEGVPRGADLLGADGVPELLIGTSGIFDVRQQLVADLETASGRALQDVLTLVDWDGDGLLDIAAKTPTGQTIVLRQNAAGGFAAARVVEVTPDPGGGSPGPDPGGGSPGPDLLANAAVGADLDADGRGDLVLALQTAELAVAFSGGDAVAARWGPDQVGANGQELAVADLDGDGRLDLAFPTFVLPGESVPVVRVLRATGPRAFTQLGSIAVPPRTQHFVVAAADATGDGLADLAVYSYVDAMPVTSLALHVQQEAGGFRAISAGAGETTAVQGTLLHVAFRDLTGDGRPDLAYPSPEGGLLRAIARGGSPDLVIAGRLEGAAATGREVVTFVPSDAGPIAVDRRRLLADGTFRAHVPGDRLVQLLAPPASSGLPPLCAAPPAPSPMPQELPLLIAIVATGTPAVLPLPPDTIAHVLVADRAAIDGRRVAGVTLSPLSTIAAIAALGGGLGGRLEADRVRTGSALGRALVAGGALDLGGGRLVATTTAQAAGLAQDDPAVLRAELEAALEAVAGGQNTSTLALARTIGVALEASSTNPVAGDLADALRNQDTAGEFSAAANGIASAVAPAPPPGFTLAPDRTPSTGGTLVTLTATSGTSFATDARGRVVGLGFQATVSSTSSTTLTFVAPPGAAGPYAVRVEQQGLETEGPPLILFQGTREAVVEPSELCFPETFLGAATAPVRTLTIQNPGSASDPLRVTGLQLRRVVASPSPEPGGAPPSPFELPALTTLAPVEPGNALAIDVRFRPVAEVQDLYVLELETDDPDQPRRTILLDAVGKGIVPLKASDLCFGFVPAGSTATGTVTLTNLAPDSLTVSVSLASGGVFSLAAPPEVTVPGGDTLDLAVTYTPAVPGVVSTDAITIQGVSTPAGPVVFNLSAKLGGAATGPRLLVLPDPAGQPLDLGLEEPGAPPLPLRIRLRNGGGKDPADSTGAADLQVTGVSLLGAGFTLLSGDVPVVLTAATLTLPCATTGGGGGGGGARVHDLVLVYDPPALASGVESRTDTATLTISMGGGLGAVSVTLRGHAATGELVRGGGPTSSPAFPALGSPSSTAVRVRVYDALTGAPLEGAQVALVDGASGAPPVVLPTGADGRVVTTTTATALDVHVGHTGYVRQSFLGTVAGDLAAALLPVGAYRGGLSSDPLSSGAQVVSSDAVAQLLGPASVSPGASAPFDAALAGPTRLAVTELTGGFTSGFGPRPGPTGGDLVLGTVPLSAGDGAAQVDVTGLLLDGQTRSRVPADTAYMAFATVEPPEPIAPLTGAVLGAMEATVQSGLPFDVFLQVRPYSAATLAGLGGRLRLHASTVESRQVTIEPLGIDVPVSTFREARIRLPAATTTFPTTASWTLPVAAQVTAATAVSSEIEVTFDDVLAATSSSTPGIYRLDVRVGGDTVVWTAFVAPLAAGPGEPPPVRTIALPFGVLSDDVLALPPWVVSVALTTFYLDLQDPDDPPLPPGTFDLDHLTGFTMHDLQRRVVGRTTDGPVAVTGGGPGGP